MANLSMFHATRPSNIASTADSTSSPLDVAGFLLSDTAHDLRSPLAAARELAQLVADGIEGPINEVQQQHLQSVVGRCNDMQRLIDDMLHFDSARTGSPRMQKAWHPLYELPESVGSSVAPTLAQRAIHLGWVGFEEELPLAYADENMLRRLLVNLIENAARQTPEDGKIFVRTQIARGGDRIRVSVEDAGAGISPENINLLARRGTSGEQGHGLGLAICRQIASAHFTQIGVESVVGKGTQFSIELPVGGPKAVVDMFAHWRAAVAAAGSSAQATEPTATPRRRHVRPRKSQPNPHPTLLPMEATPPNFPNSIAMISAYATEPITTEASHVLDRFLQGQGAMHELIYRVEQDQWIMFWDNSLAQTEQRIAEIEATRKQHSEAAVTAASIAWQGPIAMQVGSESDRTGLQEAFLRASLAIAADQPIPEIATMPAPVFSDIAQKRLDAEVKWITDKFRKRQIIMHRQSEKLRPKIVK